MAPTFASALVANKLSRTVRSLPIVFAFMISVVSSGQDVRFLPLAQGPITKNAQLVLLLQNGREPYTANSGFLNQVSIAIAPGTATVATGGHLQFTATVTNTDKTSVTWSASSGSISTGGLFTAPSQAGSVVVTATDFNGKAQASATVTVVLPLTISSTALANAQVGTTYSATLTAQGGTQPYRWSLSSGSLPSGLNMSSTGAMSGTASQAGTFTFVASVTDTSSHSSARQFTLVSKATVPTSPTPSTQGSGSFDGPAELPRVYPQSTLADTPAPGNTIAVTTGSNLQTVLNNANCGDTIQLQAGATFTGSFVLPAKTCDDQHWIVIRTSAPDSALPPEGTQVTPCYAGVGSLSGRPTYSCSSPQNSMPKLVAAKGMPTIRLAGGANHYRIGPGLEITRAVGDGGHAALISHVVPISLGIASVVIDRDWIHGTTTDDTARAINLDAITYAAVVDSYINDFHCAAAIGACTDAQAITGGDGFLSEGQWKIDNNFLESAAENILFGGSGGSIVPTDITITHNHFFKPMIWMPGYPGFVGVPNTDTTKCTSTPGYCPFIVKNLIELKNAQRLLLEGNLLENTWAGFSQHAAGMVLMAMNQGTITGNTNATVADITVRYDKFSHTGRGFSIADTQGEWGPAKLAARFSIHDDLFDDISSAYANGDTSLIIGTAFQISNCPTCSPLDSVSINHVTMLLQAPTFFMMLGASTTAPIQNVTFTNNIVTSTPGLVITGTISATPCGWFGSTDLARINSCFSSYSFVANALPGASGTWPAGNYYPSDTTAVQFVNYNDGNGGDYHLMSSSPYKNAGSDGLDLGANIDALNQAIAGIQ